MKNLLKKMLRNWEFKLFAFLLSLVLFRYVRGTQQKIEKIQIPLETRIHKDMMLTSNLTTHLTLMLRGTGMKLRGINKSALKHSISLFDLSSGSHRIEFFPEQFRNFFPTDIKILNVRPNKLSFFLEKKIKKTLPIEIRFKGKPLFGYELVKPIQPFPSEVIVEGPVTLLDYMSKIYTVPIDINELSKDTTLTVQLETQEKWLQILSTKDCRVRLRFLQIITQKTMKKIPVQWVHFVPTPKNPKPLFEPKWVDIVVGGPLAQVNQLRSKDISVELDGKKIKRNAKKPYYLDLQYRFSLPDIKMVTGTQKIKIFLPSKKTVHSSPSFRRKEVKRKRGKKR